MSMRLSTPSGTRRATGPGPIELPWRWLRVGLRPAVALAIGLAPLVGGCATVQPYQRETLSRPCMKPDPDPLGRSVEVHMHENREGATGGSGVSGGGCGCN